MSDSTTSHSSEGVTIQPLYLWPKGADLTDIKAAVVEANLPFKVRPFWFQPGKHSKCIVVSGVEAVERPPIGPEFVVPRSHKSAVAAVRWFFGLEELPVVHTALSRLQGIFGEDVRELDGPFDVDNEVTVKWSWPE